MGDVLGLEHSSTNIALFFEIILSVFLYFISPSFNISFLLT